MTKISLEVIELEWSGPFSINWDKNEKFYTLSDIPAQLQNTAGIYQVYGRHPVYGANVLLYIGKTEQSFGDRLMEHFKNRFWFHSDLSVRLTTNSIDSVNIENVESILIAAHKPALNRDHIDTAKDSAKGILVRNLEFFGSLQSECSGDYWTQKI